MPPYKNPRPPPRAPYWKNPSYATDEEVFLQQTPDAAMGLVWQFSCIFLLSAGGKTQKFDVIPIAADKIVDTNGAGDAFVGGKTSLYMTGLNVTGTKCHLCVPPIEKLPPPP